MQTQRFIDLLLKKYRQAPDFPMLDWTTNPVSFYALMNLWDELFKTAAGGAASVYVAYGDVEMDEDSNIFRVEHPDGSKLITVYPEPKGGTFHILKRSSGGYELGFATDLDPARLTAAFEIIRAFIRANLTEDGAAQALEKHLVETYHHHFGFDDFDPFEDRLGRTPPDDDEGAS